MRAILSEEVKYLSECTQLQVGESKPKHLRRLFKSLRSKSTSVLPSCFSASSGPSSWYRPASTAAADKELHRLHLSGRHSRKVSLSWLGQYGRKVSWKVLTTNQGHLCNSVLQSSSKGELRTSNFKGSSSGIAVELLSDSLTQDSEKKIAEWIFESTNQQVLWQSIIDLSACLV